MDRLLDGLNKIPEQLQSLRDELSNLDAAVNNRASNCQAVLNNLFERVYEAIAIAESMEQPQKSSTDANTSLPSSSESSNQKRQHSKSGQNGGKPGISNTDYKKQKLTKTPEDKFPKATDLQNPSKFHGAAKVEQRHQNSKGKSIDDYTCFCGQTITGYRWFNDHYFKATQRNNFKCDQCGKTFPFRRALKEHSKQKYRMDVEPCGICFKNFYTQVEYAAHTNSTNTECGRTILAKKKSGNFYFT